MEDAARLTVQNAVVELVAGAMCAPVFHLHVIVQMLPAIADEQTVDQTVAAFAGQHRLYVVAYQRTAGQHRMRIDCCAASLLDAERGDVKHFRTLAFDPVVAKDSLLPRDDLGHDVGERHADTQRDIVLEDSALAVLAGPDQVGPVRYPWD